MIKLNHIIASTATLSIILVVSPISSGQQLPTVKAATMQATVSQVSGAFLFDYTVKNPSSDTGSVIMIGLDLKSRAGRSDADYG